MRTRRRVGEADRSLASRQASAGRGGELWRARFTAGTVIAGLALAPATAAFGGDTSPAGNGEVTSAACDPDWTTVPSADLGAIGTLGDRLSAVASLPSGEAWAVGHALDAPAEGWYGGLSAVAQHWDGTSWSAFELPTVAAAISTRLDGLAALTATDVWAVGSVEFPAPGSDQPPFGHPLVLHWDGSAWSTRLVGDDGLAGNGHLVSVVALASNDVWAVGSYLPDPNSQEAVQPLAMHWDGRSWSVATDDEIGVRFASARLNAIGAAASDDVWAVGSATQDGAITETIVLHWDGGSWSTVDSPNPRRAAQRSFGSVLHDVAVLGPDDVVAVGTAGTDPLAIRWNGRRWTRIRAPVRAVAGLTGAAAQDDGTVVAVGNLIDDTTFDGLGLAMDLGRTGRIVSTQVVDGSFDTRLLDVSATGRQQWAVGSSVSTGDDDTVREHALIQSRCIG